MISHLLMLKCRLELRSMAWQPSRLYSFESQVINMLNVILHVNIAYGTFTHRNVQSGFAETVSILSGGQTCIPCFPPVTVTEALYPVSFFTTKHGSRAYIYLYLCFFNNMEVFVSVFWGCKMVQFKAVNLWFWDFCHIFSLTVVFGVDGL